METYSLEGLTLREIKALRLGLDALNIQGLDAMFIAILQSNIQTQINEVEEHIRLESLPKDPIPPLPPVGESKPSKLQPKDKG
jgi:hypothetical protein